MTYGIEAILGILIKIFQVPALNPKTQNSINIRIYYIKYTTKTGGGGGGGGTFYLDTGRNERGLQF